MKKLKSIYLLLLSVLVIGAFASCAGSSDDDDGKPDEHVYIIGGASVYRQALPFAGALCLTEVDAEAPQVDAYFPEVAPTVWQEKSRESHPADEKHPCPYAFVDYIHR